MAKTTGGIIVMDFDDVLVDTSSLMYAKIRQNWRIFSRWLVDIGPLTPKQIMNRNVYSFFEWLVKKEFINNTSRDYVKEHLLYRVETSRNVFTRDLYDNAIPTLFAQRTLLNPLYIDSENVRKVYIISRNVTKAQDASKREFIKKHFNHEKIEYISVDATESKGKALKDKNINWNLFVDDELTNIRSVAEEFDLTKKEFLMPQMGYNKVDTSLDLLIKGKGGAYTYYTP